MTNATLHDTSELTFKIVTRDSGGGITAPTLKPEVSSSDPDIAAAVLSDDGSHVSLVPTGKKFGDVMLSVDVPADPNDSASTACHTWVNITVIAGSTVSVSLEDPTESPNPAQVSHAETVPA